jgi:hypothetical protein
MGIKTDLKSLNEFMKDYKENPKKYEGLKLYDALDVYRNPKIRVRDFQYVVCYLAELLKVYQ